MRFAQGSTIKFGVKLPTDIHNVDFVVSIFQSCDGKALRFAKDEMTVENGMYVGVITSARSRVMPLGKYYCEIIAKNENDDISIAQAKCGVVAFELVCSSSKEVKI